MKTTIFIVLFTIFSGCIMAQDGDFSYFKKDANTKGDMTTQKQYSDFGPDSLYGKNLMQAKLYQLKIDHYKSMNNTGKTLAIAGIPCVMTGVVLMVVGADNASSENWDNDFDTYIKGDNQMIAGFVIGGVGVASVVTGIVLHSVGNRKLQEYQVKRDGLKISPYANLKSSGLILTYRF